MIDAPSTSLSLAELDELLTLARKHDVAEVSFRGATVRLWPRQSQAERREPQKRPSFEEALAKDPRFERFEHGMNPIG